MPDFLRDERHHRMQQPYRGFEQADQILAGQARRFSIRAVLGCQSRLDELNVPVAQLAPEEVINRSSSVVEAIGFQCLANFLSDSIEARNYPSILQRDCF